MTRPIYKTKTFWGGLATIATGVGMVVLGDIAAGTQTIMAGVLALFIRDAINTSNQ